MDNESLRRRVNSVFNVYETSREDGCIKFYGVPLVESHEVYDELASEFNERGYQIELSTEYGESVLVVERSERGFPWSNLFLALLTLLTTLFAGSYWWYSGNPLRDPAALLNGWPFALSVMGVLGSHEFGHYVMSRYHNVDATLPYFIPFPHPIGTMGAVIRVKGSIPDRKALFDIGIAGPFLGLVATVVVTIVGLHLPPVQTAAPQPGEFYTELNFPLLYDIIKSYVGAPASVQARTVNPNPVVIGGWVGMFVTFLNLLPVGQLDGGHITKSILGDTARAVSYSVPLSLFALGAYVEIVMDSWGAIWFVWGILTLLVATVGSVSTLDEGRSVGRKRVAFAVFVFALGALSFTPVPIDMVMT